VVVRRYCSGILLILGFDKLKKADVMMAQCIHCNRENPEEQVLCVYCGLPVRSSPPDAPAPTEANGMTRHFGDQTDIARFPRWGTASLGTERKLLFHVRGHDQPLVVILNDQVVLGRYDTDTDEAPEVDLEPYNALALGVSRRHVTLLIEDDTLKVVDLGSANSTYINGQKLISHQARILRDGDELRLGRLVIRVDFA
jgi:hypothetical protein